MIEMFANFTVTDWIFWLASVAVVALVMRWAWRVFRSVLERMVDER